MRMLKLGLLLCFNLWAARGEEARFFRIAGPVVSTIIRFSSEGYLTWTNAPTNGLFVLQMANSVAGPSNWVDYVRIPVTNGFHTNRLFDPNAPSGMAFIPGGLFTMGSPPDEALRYSDETQHTVTLTKDFYLGKYPVTQGQYLAVVGRNPSRFQTNDWNGNPISPDLNRPVEQVSWQDATNYCALLTQAERLAGRIPSSWAYRLPTEAEWEYSCRAGTTTTFYFGSAIHGGMANFNVYSEYEAAIGAIPVGNPTVPGVPRTTPVGSYAPNAFGLYDMHGNVSEWCSDWYGVYPNEAAVDPIGPATGAYHVFRGGSWSREGFRCRAANRNDFFPTDISMGFRVLLAPVQP